MGNFFAELKRRHMYRVAAAYAVVAWVLLQIVNNLAPALSLPNWVATTVVLLLAVGFPVALVFAWIGELKSPESKTAGSEAKITRLDYVLACALIVVIALVSYEQLAPSRSNTVQQSGVQAARNAAALPAGISIAVLPFANLSGDASQEFFSDGMTEEITSALAKITNLRVVARASAFQFKGEKKDMRAVGQALSARYLIDGSVRKAGTRVRISAQLIEAENGLQKWTENYDRELTDIFATQEDIAKAIAVSLQVPLGLQQGQNLVSNRSVDPDSYQQYLRARALVRARNVTTGVGDAPALLEQVVARNSDYAPAWAQLALAESFVPTYDTRYYSGTVEVARRIVDEHLPRAETAAQRAVQLDANLADGYVSLARVEALRGKHALAEEHYSKALAIDPNNSEALSLYANTLAGVGRLKEALAMKQRAVSMEPLIPVYMQNLASLLWLNGKPEEAIAMLRPMTQNVARASRLAVIFAGQGRYSEAADALLEQPPDPASSEAARILRGAPSAPVSLRNLEGFDYVYLYVGFPDRVIERDERDTDAGAQASIGTASYWHPSWTAARKSNRFKTFLRKAGYVEYWRAKGWPEFCHPTTGDDFECN